MKRFLLGTGILILGGLMAAADSKSAVMPVLATLLPTVSVSTTSLDFGTWKIGDSMLRASATITVQATAGLNYAIAMDAGRHFDGAFRCLVALVHKSEYPVPYFILDPSASRLWGDAGFGETYPQGAPVVGSGTGSPQSYSAIGELEASLANPVSPIGVYSDHVNVTVYY